MTFTHRTHAKCKKDETSKTYKYNNQHKIWWTCMVQNISIVFYKETNHINDIIFEMFTSFAQSSE